jgi:hypothetical protein
VERGAQPRIAVIRRNHQTGDTSRIAGIWENWKDRLRVMQQRYGYAREQAEREIDAWLA